MNRMRWVVSLAKFVADDAGVEGDGRDPVRAVATVQLAGEEDVRELAVAVGLLRRVALSFWRSSMSKRPNSLAAALAVWMTVARLATSVGMSSSVSRKPREVVDLEGLLEAVDGDGALAHDPAGVVGQHVDAGVGLLESSASARTCARSAKSATWNGAPSSSATAAVFSGDLPTMTTSWPAALRVRAAAAPIPSLAPVMTIVREVASGFTVLLVAGGARCRRCGARVGCQYAEVRARPGHRVRSRGGRLRRPRRRRRARAGPTRAGGGRGATRRSRRRRTRWRARAPPASRRGR